MEEIESISSKEEFLLYLKKEQDEASNRLQLKAKRKGLLVEDKN
jgi:hypothetical protein